MKEFIPGVLLPVVITLVFVMSLAGGIIAVANYIPNEYALSYGNYVCKVSKGWGFVEENKTCYKVK